MKAQTIFFFLLISLLFSCEAHIDVVPGEGGLFCDCQDIRFSWEATNQKGEPLNDVTILTPGGIISENASGTYSERICDSHTYVVTATNGNAKATWELNYTKVEGEVTFPIQFSCGTYIPVFTDDSPIPAATDVPLKVIRICNGYRHKSITVHVDEVSFDIPASGCINTGDICESFPLDSWQRWRITDGPIIDPSIVREDCDPRGTTSPPPGVFNPGDLILSVVTSCACP
jgi:hypothetical protein